MLVYLCYVTDGCNLSSCQANVYWHLSLIVNSINPRTMNKLLSHALGTKYKKEPKSSLYNKAHTEGLNQTIYWPCLTIIYKDPQCKKAASGYAWYIVHITRVCGFCVLPLSLTMPVCTWVRIWHSLGSFLLLSMEYREYCEQGNQHAGCLQSRKIHIKCFIKNSLGSRECSTLRKFAISLDRGLSEVWMERATLWGKKVQPFLSPLQKNV